MSEQWWSIEVTDGPFPASVWRDAHGEALIESALTHGATEWHWAEVPWGVVLEVAFPDWADWARFRDLPGVRAALDAVPDLAGGVFVYPGRGGSSGAPVRRRPLLPMGAGAAPLPESVEPLIMASDELVSPPVWPG
jgi:hypothetical protein